MSWYCLGYFAFVKTLCNVVHEARSIAKEYHPAKYAWENIAQEYFLCNISSKPTVIFSWGINL